jgi:M6 family metalloprotease-like protein
MSKLVFLLAAVVVLAAWIPQFSDACAPTEEAVEKWRAEGVLEQKLQNLYDYQVREGLHLSVWDKSMVRGYGAVSSADVNTVDTLNLCVLLVDFPDYSHTQGSVSATAAMFDSLLFSDSRTDSVINPTGSMTDYYWEASYGHLLIRGQVYGWYTADSNLSWYVWLDNGLSRSSILAREVAEKANNDVFYQDFDDPTTGGFQMHGLVIVHAGPGAEAGAPNIWSHKSSMPSNSMFDQTLIIDYIMNPEEQLGGGMSPIGVFCHEYGHTLGLPDLYDPSYTPGSEGLGRWALMAAGNYNGNSQIPSHPCGWSKANLDWLDVVRVMENQTDVVLPPLATDSLVYLLKLDPEYPGAEYWLVENRERIGFDAGLPGEGLCIYHVDESRNGNTDPYHYRVQLEQADGLNQMNFGNSRGDAGDPWPGTTNNRDFFAFSNPNSESYYEDSVVSPIAVWNISNSDSIMYADLDVTYSRPWLIGYGNDSLLFRDTIGNGDGDGDIEAGETIEFNCHVVNVMKTAFNAEASLSVDVPEIQFTNNNVPLNYLLTPLFQPRLEAPIVFQVPGNLTRRTATFTLTFYIATEYGGPLDYVQTWTFEKDVGSTPTAVGDDEGDPVIPDGFGLTQNYPNPFNPTTTISYSINLPDKGQGAQQVRLDIFNTLGRRVRTLVNQVQYPGFYTVEWDGRNEAGEEVVSGVYFYRLSRGDQTDARKMMLLK